MRNLTRLLTRIERLEREAPAWAGPVLDSQELEQDWRLWLRTLFPKYVRGQFADFHNDFWSWLWAIEPDIKPRPYIAVWFRGGAKSTSAELSCVSLGARKKRRYALYTCGTQDQADDHVANVGVLLESSRTAEYYPDLARPKVGKHGAMKGWRRTRLWTAGDFVIDAVGLDTAIRGAKLEDARPDFIIFDDIDSQKDSPDVTAKKIKALTTAILPAGSPDCAVLGIQNLIHRHSVFSRLADNRADFLANRIISGPIPMVRDAEFERRGAKWFIIGGVPTWPAMDLNSCQEKLDEWGYRAFRVEAQHEVKDADIGALFPAYDEGIHVISWSEFASVFARFGALDYNNRPCLPPRGIIARAQDWGTTHAHPCLTLWGWRPAAEMPMTDCVFIYRELGFPKSIYDPVDTLPEPVAPQPVGVAILDAERAWNETSRVRCPVMSHEASAAMNTYNLYMPDGYKNLRFAKWDARRIGGIAVIQDYLAVNKERPHPFKEGVKGRARLYLVVADDQLVEPYDHRGLMRLRQEIPAYHNPQTEGGLESAHPKKYFDDAVDALRMMADMFFPRVQHKTEEQKIEEMMPEKFRAERIAALPPGPEREGLEMSRYFAYHTARHRLREQEPKSYGLYHDLKRKYRDRTRGF